MSANLSYGAIQGLRCSVRAETAGLAPRRARTFLESEAHVHIGEIAQQSAMPEGDLNTSPGHGPTEASVTHEPIPPSVPPGAESVSAPTNFGF
jgi:hypothetical protein